MSIPPHHYLPGIPNMQQTGMRTQFGTPPLQTQMGPSMHNQLGNQMVNSMQMPMVSNQMNPQMINPMISHMPQSMSPLGSPGMSMGNTSMMGSMGQPYGMSGNGHFAHHSASPLQMQQSPIGLQHHSMQQQVLLQPPNVAPTPPAQAHQSHVAQSKELNTASLCRIGQETVQDIVSRTQEVFQALKTIQPPNGVNTPATNNDKKAKVQELLRTIRVLFKRLRLIYEKCNENCQVQGMEYTHIESLIPFKDGVDPKYDEKKNSESYRLACEESKEIMEQVILKNRQLKEVIDHLRRIIWEINTMLTMRKS